MDWKEIYFGKINRAEIKEAVADPEWQATRLYMKGKSLWIKYLILKNWLDKKHYSSTAKIQVTNYVTALSRGGLIAVEDYKEEKRLTLSH